MTVLAGISGPAEVADLVAARHEADECLALHEVWPRGATPPAYDESWDDILLQRLRTRRAVRSVPGPGTGGRAAPPRPRPRTPTTWRRCRPGWRPRATPPRPASGLGVHENTVRYRLRKMAEIANLQLDDAKKRLAMMIELAATDTD